MPVVDLTIDSSGSTRGLSNYNKAVRDSESITNSSFSKMGGAVSSFASIAITTAAATATAIAGIGVSSLAAASDMEETQGKFNVVFKGLEADAEGWAKVLSDSYGLAKEESKRYLSSIQDLVVPTGMARDAAGEMSNKFVQMAVDLASFNNLPTRKVIEDIQSALAGGSETLTKYGINVKVAQVNQEAMNMGLIQAGEKLTAAQRVQVLYNIMLREGGDAMGDFARTTDSFANQQKILTAQLSDMRVEIGSKLLPAATKIVTALNKWLKEGDKVNVMINYTVKAIQFVHNGIAGLILIGDGLVAGFALIFDKLINGFFGVLNPLNLLAEALVKMGLIENNPFDKLKQAADTFKESSKEVFNNQLAYIEKSNTGFDSMITKIEKKNEVQKEGFETMKEAIALDETEIANGRTAYELMKKKTLEEQKLRDAKRMTEGATDSTKEAEAKAVTEAKKLTAEFDKQRVSANSVTTAVDSTTQSIKAQNDAEIASEQSMNGGTTGGSNNSFTSTGLAMTQAEMDYVKANTAKGAANWTSPKASTGVTSAMRSKWANQDDLVLTSRANAVEDVMDAREANGGAPVTNIQNIFNQQFSRSDITNMMEEIVRVGARA